MIPSTKPLECESIISFRPISEKLASVFNNIDLILIKPNQTPVQSDQNQYTCINNDMYMVRVNQEVWKTFGYITFVESTACGQQHCMACYWHVITTTVSTFINHQAIQILSSHSSAE